MSATVVFPTPTSSCSREPRPRRQSERGSPAEPRPLAQQARICAFELTWRSTMLQSSRSLTALFIERTSAMHSSARKIVGPREGKAGSLGSIGVRFMIDTEETHAGGFSLVEHPMPRGLARRRHRLCATPRGRVLLRARGRMGALLGDDVAYAEAGDLVHKRETSGTNLERGRRALPDPRSSPRAASRTSSTSSSMSAPPARATRVAGRPLAARHGLEFDFEVIRAVRAIRCHLWPGLDVTEVRCVTSVTQRAPTGACAVRGSLPCPLSSFRPGRACPHSCRGLVSGRARSPTSSA